VLFSADINVEFFYANKRVFVDEYVTLFFVFISSNCYICRGALLLSVFANEIRHCNLSLERK